MQTLTESHRTEKVFDLRKQAQIPLGSTETIDGICRGEVLVIQRRTGYRFAVDPMLLASFAGTPKGRVADLGTGCGIVSLILASRGVRPITAVEIQAPLASLAMRNVALNRRGDDVHVVTADLRELKGKVPGNWFDLVVSNPPYVPLQAGHVNPGSERAIARHEVSCTPKDSGGRRAVPAQGLGFAQGHLPGAAGGGADAGLLRSGARAPADAHGPPGARAARQARAVRGDQRQARRVRGPAAAAPVRRRRWAQPGARRDPGRRRGGRRPGPRLTAAVSAPGRWRRTRGKPSTIRSEGRLNGAFASHD
ncbi:MAG: methyltransferase [Myxococcales bacterium]